ncbi:MAG TPA: DNA mismatch repair protein MutS [Bacillales bacterium]|nr:DNA mismatch repair protein MutS [Bacillales bacterium]
MAYTPMIQQYLSIKEQYRDAFLFFRLGDFYEMFFEDANRASKELEITLTSRDGGGEERIPMCGVPYHSADNYISQLIEKGYKIAICEQMEDPKQTKGMVHREVVQLITPGTVMEGKTLSEKENNFIAAISVFENDTYGLAVNDLTTGENRLTLFSGGWEEAVQEVSAVGAIEVIIPEDLSEERRYELQQQLELTLSEEKDTTVPEPFQPLAKKLDQKKMQMTFGRLLQYLLRTQKRSLDHLQPVEYFENNQYMKIDVHSKRNLELVETIRRNGKKGSLLWLLDRTMTAMGGRRLKQWIERPLLNRSEIEARLSVVEALKERFFEREELRDQLKGVYDLERLAGRVAFGNVNARDLVQLKKSLERVPEIIEAVRKLDNPKADQITENIDLCEQLVQNLEEGLVDDPPLSVKEGGLIRDGFNEKLGEYRDASKNGKEWIASLQQSEREATGIKSLKVGYNRVFGYYIEVTRANLSLLPEGRYERKQTLTNAERFITPELKEKEALILEAEEKMLELEYELFLNLREETKAYIPQLQRLARQISELDVLQSFAVISEERQYTKPEFSKGREIEIQDGRHPVVEKVLEEGTYVANHLSMDENREILLITGPNMAGKSTYMRQLALTAVMMQIGCFVPAAQARMPLFDQVFTRIGAADDLVGGQSTFMVEMLETRYALSKATQNSLILLDEIGRGTSTYDGIALAQAIIEFIHHDIHAKTLFSTHYHELTALGDELDRLQNVHVGAVEEDGDIVFLHKVVEGAADESYGIHVAKLADLPDDVIDRASVILKELENSVDVNDHAGEKARLSEKRQSVKEENGQLSFFVGGGRKSARKTRNKQEEEALKKLKSLDLLSITPLDAINKLYELQKSLSEKE